MKRLSWVFAAMLSLLLVMPACAFQGAGSSPSEHVVSATEGTVRLIGRTVSDDGTTWLPQSGSAIEFEVIGSRATIDLASGAKGQDNPDLCPRFAVLVDGEVVFDDVLFEPQRTVEVALDPSVASVVEVIHLSEAVCGAVGVRSITVESSEESPVVPTEDKGLSIEFIGDSITCGYGVEGEGGDEPFMTTTENFMKSYAYLTAQALGADYSAVCYSGYGVVSGWTGDGERNEGMLVPLLYEVVAKGYEQPWDFDAHSYDVVVISLGTNDYTYARTDEARMEEFTRGYASFLEEVRAHNPESLIVCTMGTMGCHELYPYLEEAVESFEASTGDTRVLCYLSEEIDYEADGTGTHEHPNAVTQQKSADALVAVIDEALGL